MRKPSMEVIIDERLNYLADRFIAYGHRIWLHISFADYIREPDFYDLQLRIAKCQSDKRRRLYDYNTKSAKESSDPL